MNGIKSTMKSAGAFGVGAYGRSMPSIKSTLSTGASSMGFGMQAGKQALRSGMDAYRGAGGYAGGMGVGRSAMAGLKAGGSSLGTSFMGASNLGKAGMIGAATAGATGIAAGADFANPWGLGWGD